MYYTLNSVVYFLTVFVKHTEEDGTVKQKETKWISLTK